MARAAETIEKLVTATKLAANRPGFENWESMLRSGKLQRLVSDGMRQAVPRLKELKQSSRGRLDALKAETLDTLQPLFRSGEELYRSEEFQAFTASVSDGIRGLGDSLRSVVETEEFKNLAVSVTTGMQDAAHSWKPAARSQEFQDLKTELTASAARAGTALWRAGRNVIT